MDSRMSLINRLKFQLQGYVNSGLKEHPDTKSKIEYFTFKCPIHGLVEDYRHGYSKYLECPMCREKKINEMYATIKKENSVQK